MPAHDPRSTASSSEIFQPLHADDPAEVAGYRLYARLGSGGMGRVYLSYTPGGRPVALKVVRPEFAEDPEFRRRFAQEVANAQRIHGLYTAQVIDSGATADAPWLVTAYVPGPSLQQVVREYGALPLQTVLMLMGGIAEALQVIHNVQVVHRDLKPANVLLAADGPRVIDFGIARAADATSLTSTGLRIGSPSFMAPEQARGRPVTPATDVFALGALATYVVGGVPPFGEGPETAVLYRVVHEEPDLSAVPADLRDLLLRCLSKVPEHRPTPAEIIEAARSHPAVGGQLRFTEDWLPQLVNREIARRSDLPDTPAAGAGARTGGSYGTDPRSSGSLPSGALLSGAQSSGAQSSGPLPSDPYASAPGAFVPQPEGLQQQRSTMLLRAEAPVGPSAEAPTTLHTPARRRPWKPLAAAAAVLAVGGTAVALLFSGGHRTDDHAAGPTGTPTAATVPSASRPAGSATPDRGTGSPSAVPTGSTAPSAAPSATGQPPRVTAVYTNRTLTIPSDADYQFDLPNGRVVPGGGTSWHISTYGPYYELPDGTDGFIVPDGTPPTPEQCAVGLDRSPTGNELRASDLPAGHSFCLRQRSTGALAILKVIKPADSLGATTASVSYYRNAG